MVAATRRIIPIVLGGIPAILIAGLLIPFLAPVPGTLPFLFRRGRFRLGAFFHFGLFLAGLFFLLAPTPWAFSRTTRIPLLRFE